MDIEEHKSTVSLSQEKLLSFSDKLLKSENMLIEIMSWLPGNTIVHRVALASKRFRHVSMLLGPLT